MAAIAAAGVAVVGAGVQIYGAIKTANDQAEMDLQRAAIANQQATEIGEREAANETLRNQQAYRQKLQFGASFAATGREGTGIGSQLQIQNQTDLANMMSNREADFQAKMLKQQAGIDTTLAGQTESAGVVKALGMGLGGATQAAGYLAPRYGGTQSMGAYGGG